MIPTKNLQLPSLRIQERCSRGESSITDPSWSGGWSVPFFKNFSPCSDLHGAKTRHCECFGLLRSMKGRSYWCTFRGADLNRGIGYLEVDYLSPGLASVSNSSAWSRLGFMLAQLIRCFVSLCWQNATKTELRNFSNEKCFVRACCACCAFVQKISKLHWMG